MYKQNAPYSVSLDLLVGVYDTHLWTIFVWWDFLFRVFLFNLNCDIKISSFFFAPRCFKWVYLGAFDVRTWLYMQCGLSFI